MRVTGFRDKKGLKVKIRVAQDVILIMPLRVYAEWVQKKKPLPEEVDSLIEKILIAPRISQVISWRDLERFRRSERA